MKSFEWMKATSNLMMLAAMPIVFLPSCSTHRFHSHLPSAQKIRLPFYLEFEIPEQDKKNTIEAVFCDSVIRENMKRYEITVVFKDEDHPFFLADWCYDLYRRVKYKRKMDVETFFVSCAPNDSFVTIDLKDVYSSAQDYKKGIVKHGDMNYVDMVKSIRLFVNTRNHLFSIDDNNPGMKKMIVKDPLIYPGSRERVEELFRR